MRPSIFLSCVRLGRIAGASAARAV